MLHIDAALLVQRPACISAAGLHAVALAARFAPILLCSGQAVSRLSQPAVWKQGSLLLQAVPSTVACSKLTRFGMCGAACSAPCTRPQLASLVTSSAWTSSQPRRTAGVPCSMKLCLHGALQPNCCILHVLHCTVSLDWRARLPSISFALHSHYSAAACGMFAWPPTDSACL